MKAHRGVKLSTLNVDLTTSCRRALRHEGTEGGSEAMDPQF
jgi:hypothetical protein